MRLHCYPGDDGDFAATSELQLGVNVPDGTVLLDAVLARLRGRYPAVAIRTEDGVDGGDDGHVAVWHVYRDGLPVDGA